MSAPEQRLFVSVILNAVMEATGRGSVERRNGEDERAKRGARRWFREAGEDFELVCTLAGMEPQVVRTAVLEYIAHVEALPSRSDDDRPRRQRATLRDVAERAGVSTITVARALDQHPRVAPDTRRRVMSAAADVGYRSEQNRYGTRRLLPAAIAYP